MDAVLDNHWLLGNPEWWNLKDELPPDIRNGELTPNSNWATSTPRLGNHGWMRQRMKPLAYKLLFPLAWAPFFLILTVIPLVFSGETPNDQLISFIFFSISWILVIYPLFDSRELQLSHINSIYKLPIDWNLLFIGIAIFPIHILVDPRFGWISYLFLCAAMYRTIRLIQNMMLIPPSRFVLPIEIKNWNSGDLNNSWSIKSNKWNIGPIAHYKCLDGYLTLSGIRRSKVNFLSITFVHKSGFIQDPFFKREKEDLMLINMLQKPPIIMGNSWPEKFLITSEEE